VISLLRSVKQTLQMLPAGSSIHLCNSGGEAQKLSLPQLLDVDVVDAVDALLGVAGTLGVFGVLGVAGIIGPAGRERTDMIEQSLDVDILAKDTLDDVERASSCGAGVIKSDNERFAGRVCL
jgi:hypothetical protein